MKRIGIVLILILLAASAVHAQIEQGDTEVSFLGQFSTIVGEDVDPNGFGFVQLSFGKYFTRNLLMGIAPSVSFATAQDEDGDQILEADFSGSAFLNFNFTTASTFVPYFTAQYYQRTFDIPEGREFTDYSYVNIGLGFKNFFNEYAAFNTLISYGFSLAEVPEGASKTGILVISTGLSFIF